MRSDSDLTVETRWFNVGIFVSSFARALRCEYRCDSYLIPERVCLSSFFFLNVTPVRAPPFLDWE